MTSNRRLCNPWYVPLHMDEKEVKYFKKRRLSVHGCSLFDLDEDQLETVALSMISMRIRTWHECGNWYWGRAIPFLGIYVSNFRHCVFAVYPVIWTQARGLISKVETIISVIFSERPRLMSGLRGPGVRYTATHVYGVDQPHSEDQSAWEVPSLLPLTPYRSPSPPL
jgi:hypothetical protein